MNYPALLSRFAEGDARQGDDRDPEARAAGLPVAGLVVDDAVVGTGRACAGGRSAAVHVGRFRRVGGGGGVRRVGRVR